MLEHLLETGARRKKSAWGGIVSITVHSAIIGIVVVATATADPGPTRTHGDTTLIRLAPPPDRDATIRDGHGGKPATGGKPTVPTIPIVPTIDVSSTIEPPLPNVGSTSAGADTSLLAAISGAMPNGEGPVSGAGIASSTVVDLPIRAVVDRTPRYPEMLRAAGIAGTVRVQFVVDTLGRVEPASIRVLDSSHAQFTDAVIAALRQSRFTAGAVAGRRVRTLVERSFRFDIAGGAR